MRIEELAQTEWDREYKPVCAMSQDDDILTRHQVWDAVDELCATLIPQLQGNYISHFLDGDAWNPDIVLVLRKEIDMRIDAPLHVGGSTIRYLFLDEAEHWFRR